MTRSDTKNSTTRVLALLITASFALSLVPTASAARAEAYVASSGSIPLDSPMNSNNYQYHAICPVGQPRPCGMLTHGWNGDYVDFQFTITGAESDLGVDRVFVEGSGDRHDALCEYTLLGPHGGQHSRFDSSCRPYFGWVDLLPAGTYTLRLYCYCNSGGYAVFYDLTYKGDYLGWDVWFNARSSHALLPARAESPQPRACFEFWAMTSSGLKTWIRELDVTVSYGDGNGFAYTAWTQIDLEERCHAYLIPAGVTVVCMTASDRLGRTASECRPVDRGISVS